MTINWDDVSTHIAGAVIAGAILAGGGFLWANWDLPTLIAAALTGGVIFGGGLWLWANWKKVVARPWAISATIAFLAAVIAAGIVFAIVETQLDDLKKNLSTWKTRNTTPDEDHTFFKVVKPVPPSAIEPGFNCDAGYYMVGVTIFNNDLVKLQCRPLAGLASH